MVIFNKYLFLLFLTRILHNINQNYKNVSIVCTKINLVLKTSTILKRQVPLTQWIPKLHKYSAHSLKVLIISFLYLCPTQILPGIWKLIFLFLGCYILSSIALLFLGLDRKDVFEDCVIIFSHKLFLMIWRIYLCHLQLNYILRGRLCLLSFLNLCP